MAKVGELDFRAYVDAKEAQSNHEHTVDRAYAYVSDRQTRSTFDKVKPVEMAVSSAVRMMRQVGRGELLGTAVKVGPKQFPRVHEITAHCADTLGIAPPAVYIRNNPNLNAMTYGTNDDAFVLIHSALVDHFSDEELEAFPGHAMMDGGYMYSNNQPGLGIDIDEDKAAKLLKAEPLTAYYAAEDRRADGGIVRP